MSSAPTRDSPNKPDVRPSFRKPSNDGAHRKYRHHSPVDGSDSTSSGVSPKREQNIIRVNSLENKSKVPDDRAGKYHGKDSERDLGYSHSSRASDSHRYPEDKNSVLYSGRELRGGRSDHAKHDNSFERSKESRNADKNTDRYHFTDKTENSSHRSRGKDREGNAPDNRYSEKESSRAASGSWQIASKRDYKRVDEWDRHRERNDRDDRRIRHRSPSDYRKEITPTSEDSRRHDMDTFIGRESASYRLKESQQMEIDEQDYQVHKRRYNDRDSRKYKDKYSLDPDGNRKESDSFSVYQGREEKRKIYVDKNSNSTEDLSSSKKLKLGQSDKFPLNMPEEKPSSSKQVKEATEKVTLAPHVSTINHTESAQDLNAAKVAAMQAAELVNRNLVGTGFMSTDQKKKLLWGNKKNTSEESGTRWDLQLFDDRERQEKFNKLMGVKGDTIQPERKPDEKDMEKQKELQIDLEKQYTAGLRRRDGRTVGLGL